MRQKKLIWLIFLFISDFAVFGQTGIIQGNVYDKIDEKGLFLAQVWLVNTNLGAITDYDGNFKIDSIPIGTYDLKISFMVYGDTTLKNIIISSDTVIKINIELPPPCKYDNNRKDNRCPICGKKNMVIPIVYGIPIGKLDKKHYYYAGCVITFCDPHWFCKRDKYKF